LSRSNFPLTSGPKVRLGGLLEGGGGRCIKPTKVSKFTSFCMLWKFILEFLRFSGVFGFSDFSEFLFVFFRKTSHRSDNRHPIWVPNLEGCSCEQLRANLMRNYSVGDCFTYDFGKESVSPTENQLTRNMLSFCLYFYTVFLCASNGYFFWRSVFLVFFTANFGFYTNLTHFLEKNSNEMLDLANSNLNGGFGGLSMGVQSPPRIQKANVLPALPAEGSYIGGVINTHPP